MRRARTGRLQGDRLSRRKGRGSEFADSRPYAQGDDTRFLDWSVYARLDRLFLRLFREEEDLPVYLLVDLSASMWFGTPSKLHLARQLVAAFSWIGLVNLDRVSVVGFTDRPVVRSPVFRGRAAFPRLLTFIESLQTAGQGDFSRAMRTTAMGLSGCGLVVLLSDFLDKGSVAGGLQSLLARQKDLFAIQILSEEEMKPRLVGDLRLTDIEDGDQTEITVTALMLANYQQSLSSFRAELTRDMARHGVPFLSTDTRTPFDQLILNTLRIRGMIH